MTPTVLNGDSSSSNQAPVTGYMFGKGLYFADMSSKSANYCFATKENPYVSLLLPFCICMFISRFFSSGSFVVGSSRGWYHL